MRSTCRAGSISIAPGPSGFTLRSEANGTGSPIDDAGIPLGLTDDDFALVELPFRLSLLREGIHLRVCAFRRQLSRSWLRSRARSNATSRARPADRRGSRHSSGISIRARGGKVRFLSQGSRAVVIWDEVPLFSDFGDREAPDIPDGPCTRAGGSSLTTERWTCRAPSSARFRGSRLGKPWRLTGARPSQVRSRASRYWQRSLRTESVLDEYGDRPHVLQNTRRRLRLPGCVQFDRPRSEQVLPGPRLPGAERHRGNRRADRGLGSVSSARAGGSQRSSTWGGLSRTTRISPFAPIPGLPHSSLLTILAHEIGHRFLAYPKWIDPETGETHEVSPRQAVRALELLL